MKEIALHKNNPNKIHNRIIAIWVRHTLHKTVHETATQLMFTPRAITDQPFSELYRIHPQ